MVPTWFFLIVQLSVIICGLISGVFLTFSDFVMRSLGGAKNSAGIEAMQVINREVFRSVFMVLFLGMSVLSPFLVGYAYFNVEGLTSGLIVAGGAVYFVGVFLVTALFNVPMNNHLATLNHSGAAAASYWENTYLPRWTSWNFLRAIASGASAICLLSASLGLAQQTILLG